MQWTCASVTVAQERWRDFCRAFSNNVIKFNAGSVSHRTQTRKPRNLSAYLPSGNRSSIHPRAAITKSEWPSTQVRKPRSGPGASRTSLRGQTSRESLPPFRGKRLFLPGCPSTPPPSPPRDAGRYPPPRHSPPNWVSAASTVAPSSSPLWASAARPTNAHHHKCRNAYYNPHTHDGLTTHVVLDGELTISFPEDARPEKRTYGVGERIDVEAERLHEVWIGKNGCTYVIGEE